MVEASPSPTAREGRASSFGWNSPRPAQRDRLFSGMAILNRLGPPPCQPIFDQRHHPFGGQYDHDDDDDSRIHLSGIMHAARGLDDEADPVARADELADDGTHDCEAEADVKA